MEEQVVKDFYYWYDYLTKREDTFNKYNKSGVYCIKRDNQIVYVGQSINMLKRIATHLRHINIPEEKEEKKYKVLRDWVNKGYKISFDVLYEGNEYIQAEAEIIYELKPMLNSVQPRFNRKKRIIRRLDGVKFLDFERME